MWLCPAKLEDVPGLVHPKENKPELYVDIGAYGNPKSDKFAGPKTVAKVESFVIENNGYVVRGSNIQVQRDIYCQNLDHKG